MALSANNLGQKSRRGPTRTAFEFLKVAREMSY
jgi:hypothetical protein